MENERISDFFKAQTHLFIKQVKNWGEILIGFEAKNKYKVLDSQGMEHGFIVEKGAGILAFFIRWISRSHRPLDVRVYDSKQNEILKYQRPFYFFFSTAHLYDSQDQIIGRIDQKFAIFKKKYQISDHQENVVGEIESGFFKFFQFEIQNRMGQKIGEIKKKWGGLLKEVFADHDTFGLSMNEELDTRTKALIFATAISIDFDYFEDNQGGNSPLQIFD